MKSSFSFLRPEVHGFNTHDFPTKENIELEDCNKRSVVGQRAKKVKEKFTMRNTVHETKQVFIKTIERLS